MEELDIKQLWHAYDLKLEKSLQLNQKIIKDLQTQKAESRLAAFGRDQLFGVIVGIVLVLFLAFLVLNHLNNIYFATSVGFIALFNLFAVAAYIRHLVMLSKVNIADSITQAQQRLATLQASLINVGKILILQTPFYCTFWYNDYLLAHASTTFWLVNIATVAIFVAACIYVYNTLSYKNIHIKWVNAVIQSFGDRKLTKAIEFLNEIDNYKTGG